MYTNRRVPFKSYRVELSDKKPARGQSNRGANSGVINRNEVHVSFVSSFLVC